VLMPDVLTKAAARGDSSPASGKTARPGQPAALNPWNDPVAAGTTGSEPLGWQPQQVFNAYVKSLKDGEFTYNTTIHQGRATYIQKITIGGVDFTNLNLTAVSAAQMNQNYPQLAQAAKSSVSQLTSSDGTFWLGDTIAPPTGSLWSKVTDPLRTFASGRAGILILVLAGLGVVIFGIRRGSRRGWQAT
jgi:hypothetical protein